MRGIVKVALALVLTAAAAGCGGGGAGDSGGKTVRLYVGGDVNVREMWERSLIPAFEKANEGYKVNLTFSEHGVNDTSTLTKIGASIKAKRDPGVDLAEGGFVPTAAISGFLEKVDATKIANLESIEPTLLEPVKGSATPYRGSSVVLAYNSKEVPAPPKSMAELIAWIKANPGKFTYNSPNTGGSGQAFVVTVLDQYVPAADRAKMVAGYAQELETHWDKGFVALRGLNDSVYKKVYPNGNQEVLNLLGKGQIAMAPVWSDMALSGLKSGLLGPDIKLTQLSNPSFTGGAAYLGIPSNSPNKDAAYKLLNFLLEPAQQEKIIDVLAGYPAVPVEKLSAEMQKRFEGLDTQHLRQSYSQNMIADLNNLWQQKVPG